MIAARHNFIAVSGVALLMLAVTTAQAATVTVYNGLVSETAATDWAAAAGAAVVTEDFEDTTLVGGLSITFGSGAGARPGSITGGLYQDRANDSQDVKPAFTFLPPVKAFGANWFLNEVPPGTTVSPGIRLHLTFADGSTDNNTVIPFSFTGQFFGIVSNTPIVSMRFDEGPDNPERQPSLVETFDMDNALFGPGLPSNATVAATGLSLPFGLAVSAQGEIFVADRNRHVVLRVVGSQLDIVAGVLDPVEDAAGVRTYNGGYNGDSKPADEARLNSPSGVAHVNGKLYIADTGNHIIREVDLLAPTRPSIRTVAGIPGTNGPAVNGIPATEATLFGPRGVAVDATGNVYVSDTQNQQVRKLTPDLLSPGTFDISAVAGTAGSTGGPLTPGLNSPQGIAVDADGSVYIADEGNHVIRKATVAEVGFVLSTVAGLVDNSLPLLFPGGRGIAGFSGDGGPATDAKLDSPSSVAVGADGSLYIADTDNRRVRVVVSGVIGTLAGTNLDCTSGPPPLTNPVPQCSVVTEGTLASALPLNAPVAVATDSAGHNLYIADLPQVTVTPVQPGTEDQDVTTVEAFPGVLGRVLHADHLPVVVPVSPIILLQ